MINLKATFEAMVKKAKLVLVLSSTASLAYAAVLLLSDAGKVSGADSQIKQLVWALFLVAPAFVWFMAMFSAVLVLWPMYFSGRLDDRDAMDNWWRKTVIPRKDSYLRWAFVLFLTGFAFLAIVLVTLLVV